MIGDKVRGIGEIVLRVRNMQLMRDFYVYTLGFKPIRSDDKYVFLELAEGHGGHKQILALFDPGNATAFGAILNPVANQASPLHHFALEIDLNDYHSILKELKTKNVEYVTETFEWVKWRSVFIKDPEGNILEFVCYDPEI